MCRAGDRGQGEEGGSGDQGVEEPLRNKPSIPSVVLIAQTSNQNICLHLILKGTFHGKHDFPCASEFM